jgi:hypothetical protein
VFLAGGGGWLSMSNLWRPSPADARHVISATRVDNSGNAHNICAITVQVGCPDTARLYEANRPARTEARRRGPDGETEGRARHPRDPASILIGSSPLRAGVCINKDNFTYFIAARTALHPIFHLIAVYMRLYACSEGWSVKWFSTTFVSSPWRQEQLWFLQPLRPCGLPTEWAAT